MKTSKAPRRQKKQTSTLGIAVDHELRQKIQAAADEERRPISQYARIILERAMEHKQNSAA